MKRLKGLLVVNDFVHSEKFTELFVMLQEAAVRAEMELISQTNATLWTMLFQTSYQLKSAFPDVDFILFWDKDVKLAKELEQQGYPVFNSSRSIALCDDKALTFLALKNKGIRMPDTLISPKKFHADGQINEAFLQTTRQRLGFPCVVKECLGSFGQQVYLAENMDALQQIILSIGERGYLVQEYISCSKGRDVRVQMVGDTAVAAMYRYNEHDFRANISNGGSMQFLSPTPEQVTIAAKACKILGLDFAGVDLLFDESDQPILCEVNSNAHFKNLYDCTGINTADAILNEIKRKCL